MYFALEKNLFAESSLPRVPSFARNNSVAGSAMATPNSLNQALTNATISPHERAMASLKTISAGVKKALYHKR